MADATQPKSASKEAVDYSARVTHSYMVGQYLAVNAINDFYLLIEGPDCSYMKTQYVQGNHDWMSTLTSVSGFHRIANTALHPDQMTGSREKVIVETLVRIASDAGVPAVGLTSMPMAFITGADYDRLTRQVSIQTGKQILHIPGKSLSGDWLDGYSDVLSSLAQQMELPSADLHPSKVGIVGYLHDRNEGDHSANIAELHRMLGALDLDLVSTWFDGSSFARLSDIAEAGTILSLPYGRRAARKLARRTGARLIELPLPFGLTATEDFLRMLGTELGRETQAEAFISAELSHIAPKLEWVIPFLFQNRTLAFVGEPHVFPGILDFTQLVGMKFPLAIFTNRGQHMRELQSLDHEVDILVYPKMNEMMNYVNETLERGGLELHLVVANNLGIIGEGAVLEFGFPSMFRHALFDWPFLGFRGALCFLDAMANTMRINEMEQVRQQMRNKAMGERPGFRRQEG